MKRGRKKGFMVSEETRKKMSEANKGNKNCLGYKHTDEARKKISENRKGKPTGMLGKKHTEEWKRIHSERMKGSFRSTPYSWVEVAPRIKI